MTDMSDKHDGCPTYPRLLGQFARVTIERDRWWKQLQHTAHQSKARREEMYALLEVLGLEIKGDRLAYDPKRKPGDLRHSIAVDIRAALKAEREPTPLAPPSEPPMEGT